MLFGKGLATSTLHSYTSAQKRYLNFCAQFKISPEFPITENILCYFVSALSNDSLKHQSIKCYLSGIHHAQIALGHGDPFASQSMPRLEYVLKGIKRRKEKNAQSKPRLPITVDLLQKMFKVWEDANDPDAVMLPAACCLGFFGFLRAAEFMTPSSAAYDPGCHLSLANVALDSHSAPTTIRIAIKQSKTDPYRKGVHIFIGQSFTDICPVQRMIAYLATRGPSQGPLFMHKDGQPLSRSSLVKKVRSALTQAGMDASIYSGHSFRIGAASTAAAKGVEDALIQILGRWQSTAYLRYVKLPREQLASIAQVLAS